MTVSIMKIEKTNDELTISESKSRYWIACVLQLTAAVCFGYFLTGSEALLGYSPRLIWLTIIAGGVIASLVIWFAFQTPRTVLQINRRTKMILLTTKSLTGTAEKNFRFDEIRRFGSVEMAQGDHGTVFYLAAECLTGKTVQASGVPKNSLEEINEMAYEINNFLRQTNY
jgi:hypothetical protein